MKLIINEGGTSKSQRLKTNNNDKNDVGDDGYGDVELFINQLSNYKSIKQETHTDLLSVR